MKMIKVIVTEYVSKADGIFAFTVSQQKLDKFGGKVEAEVPDTAFWRSDSRYHIKPEPKKVEPVNVEKPVTKTKRVQVKKEATVAKK